MNPTIFNRLVISGFVATTIAVIYLFIQNRRINSRLNIELAAFNNNFKEISNVLSNTISNTQHNLTPVVTEEFKNNIEMQQNEIDDNENYDQLSLELKKELENLEIRESSNDEEPNTQENTEVPEYNEVSNDTPQVINTPMSPNIIDNYFETNNVNETIVENTEDNNTNETSDIVMDDIGEVVDDNDNSQDNIEMNDYANLESDNYHTDSMIDDIISNVKENANQINSETEEYYGKPIEFFNKLTLSELQDIARKDKIKVKGKKNELIERLFEFYNN